MRVLQLIDSLEAGGAERMAVNIANALSATIERSYLCATRKEGHLKEFIDTSVSYLFLNKKSVLGIRSLIKLRNYIRKNKITIIHAHSSSFFLAALLKITYPKVKVIWHDHFGNSDRVEHRPYFVLKQASYLFNAIISVNTKLVNWAKSTLNTKHIVFLANFADTKNNLPSSISLSGKEGKRIVCLANLRPQKGHQTLLKAFEFLREDFPEWTLHLLGKTFDDPYEKEIRNIIGEKELPVYLYGSVTNVSALLSICDIGVLSSYSEGLPLALLEYGLSKLAIVVTDVGECKKVVFNEQNGILVAPNKPEDFANALRILISDKEKRLKKAQNFNRHIENNYTKEKFINKLMTIYEEA